MQHLVYLSTFLNQTIMLIFVQLEDRYKFVDDLTLLEVVNLLTVGITSYNLKQHIPSDLPLHNQFIPPQNLHSQDWLDSIDEWAENQKMVINENKLGLSCAKLR